jgi:hypothetical protein
VNAIKEVRKYLQNYPGSDSAKALAKLVSALAEERDYSLAELYAMDIKAFELAMQLLNDWRLDRYYAQRLKLYDIAVSGVLPPAAGAPAANEPAQ